MGYARLGRVLFALVFVVGCSSASPSPSPSVANPSGGPPSAYDQLFGQVGDDGSVSMDTALQAFALAIAPLPGVTPPDGPDPPLYERMDGTFALDWLLPYMSELTPDQQAAVTAAITPASDSVTIQPGQTPVAGNGIVLAADRQVADDSTQDPALYYKGLALVAMQAIAANLGRSLTVPVEVSVNQTQVEIGRTPGNEKDWTTLAYTIPGFTPGGAYKECDIFINPKLATDGDPTDAHVTMAHEVFHCFQFQLEINSGNTTFLHDDLKNPRYGWIIEGQAEWAGEAIAGPSQVGNGWWTDYLVYSRRPLFARTYDAVGFYQHLKETGVDPWSIFDAMLETNSNADAFTASQAQDDTFLDSWASGMSLDTALPAAWNAQAPWTAAASALFKYVPVTNGDVPLEVEDPPVTTADWELASTADVTELDFSGHVRMYTSGTDTPNLTDVTDLCTNTTAQGCNCPPGEQFDGPPLQPSDGTIFLGFTGSLQATTGTIKGRPLSDFCHAGLPANPQPRGGSDPCAIGCAGSVGDPHFQTLDQPAEFYDFQAAGEYTLLRSPDGSMEIQGRQVPYPEGDALTVSVNKALAWKVAGHRIGMYIYPGSDSYTLMLDGEQLDLASVGTMDLGGGAALTVMTDGIEVAYGDGTISTVFFDGVALSLQVAPSATFRSQAVGLLGHIAAGSELPALPDGTALPRSTDPTTRYTQRYKQLGPAWLVTDQTTLFDYQPGETTATFYQPDFPSPDDPLDPGQDALKLLPGVETFDQAAEQCAGVQSDQAAYQNCIYDSLVTGDPQFAQIYATLEQFLAAGPTVLESPQASVTPSTPTPEPTVSGALPAGVELVDSGVAAINGETVASDGTVYASLSMGPDYTPELVSILPSGQPGAKVQPAGVGRLFLLDGSLWLAENEGSGLCQLERFDSQTLASQAKIPIVCDLLGADATAVSDGIWWADGTGADANGRGGMLRHIDPATNTVDRSVALPFVNGNLSSSANTVVYGDSAATDGWYMLPQGATAMTQVTPAGLAQDVFAANDGFWYQPADVDLQNQVNFVSSSSSSETTLPVDGYLEAADDHAVYVTPAGGNPETLVRYPTDGSGQPETILTGTSVATPSGSDDLGFFDNNPLVIANQKLAKLWQTLGYPADGVNSVLAETLSVP